MLIAKALRETATEEALLPVHIAAKVDRSEQTARKWMNVDARPPCIPPGDVLLKLMAQMPGLARRLGFEMVDDRAA